MHSRLEIKCLLSGLIIQFSFLIALPFSVFAQQDFDVSEPIDTTETEPTLVAKGPSQSWVSEADLRERLSTLNGCVELRTNAVVRSYVKTYTMVKPEKARMMLGKRLTYFPLFEQKLREYGLPNDLKYLAVVESALNPKAVSRVGATGLWQFMPSTGSDYGLRTNSAVEERSDPVKSTDAAMRYLRDLHKQFNDWALALAAYNSGPGRVNSAIRRAGSRSFWRIQRYLPQETRNYVPAFIASTYICNYFQLHGLLPHDPDFDEQLTNYIKVFEGISFRDISDATGVDYKTIGTLNPGFRRGYVPPSTSGYNVVLPERVMPAFIRYLNSLGSRVYSIENSGDYSNVETGDGRYWPSVVTAEKDEHIELFASRIGFNAEHLKTWNRLQTNTVAEGQAITLWRPVYVQKHQKLRIVPPDQGNRNGPGRPGNPQVVGQTAATSAQPLRPNPAVRLPSYQFHTVRRNESLEDIARQYDTNVEQLRRLNQLQTVKAGIRLKVKEQ